MTSDKGPCPHFEWKIDALLCRRSGQCRIDELEAEVESLERFRRLRLRHNDELERAVARNAKLEAERDEAVTHIRMLANIKTPEWAATSPAFRNGLHMARVRARAFLTNRGHDWKVDAARGDDDAE